MKKIIPLLNIKIQYKQDNLQQLMDHNYMYEVNKMTCTKVFLLIKCTKITWTRIKCTKIKCTGMPKMPKMTRIN